MLACGGDDSGLFKGLLYRFGWYLGLLLTKSVLDGVSIQMGCFRTVLCHTIWFCPCCQDSTIEYQSALSRGQGGEGHAGATRRE